MGPSVRAYTLLPLPSSIPTATPGQPRPSATTKQAHTHSPTMDQKEFEKDPSPEHVERLDSQSPSFLAEDLEATHGVNEKAVKHGHEALETVHVAADYHVGMGRSHGRHGFRQELRGPTGRPYLPRYH